MPFTFGEMVIALVDSGRKSATYKLATLLALIDVVTAKTRIDDPSPGIVSGREVGRRVIELYWPQTADYRGHPLRQSAQNDIPAKLARWRQIHGLEPEASLEDARRAKPDEWLQLEADLVGIVIGMPLAKLQRFGDGRHAAEERFIYQFGWRDEVKPKTVARADFDDSLILQPRVGKWLVQLAPLLRPLVQTKWAALVARQNQDVVDIHQLDEFLFGATRISLDRVRAPLVEAQHGRCFYCRLPMRAAEVDHFLPWSRYPDNTLDNLVAAHRTCNGAKSASIAALEHLEAWCERFHEGAVEQIATDTGWPRRRDRSIGATTATYVGLPNHTRLWLRGQEYERVESKRIQGCLQTLT